MDVEDQVRLLEAVSASLVRIRERGERLIETIGGAQDRHDWLDRLELVLDGVGQAAAEVDSAMGALEDAGALPASVVAEMRAFSRRETERLREAAGTAAMLRSAYGVRPKPGSVS